MRAALDAHRFAARRSPIYDLAMRWGFGWQMGPFETWQAAGWKQVAQWIDEDIQAMAMGYATVLTEGGASLSGGQRQRLVLARALAHRPSVFLLDEATSALDTVTETAVYRNLASLDSTVIVIAHRLSTITRADLIVVMDGGKVVEQGAHDDLLARTGHYRGLVSGQVRAYG